MQVLSLALGSADPVPLLLVCTPGVPVLPIVWAAAQAAQAHQRLVKVDHITLRKDAPDAFFDQMAQLLSEAATTKKLTLFFDATGQKTQDVLELLVALQPSLADGNPRLLVAVSADACAPVMEANPDLEGVQG
jgi:hypothetical protein